MPVTTVDNWQYARWVYIIARSFLQNHQTNAEQTAIQDFVTAISATRPWLVTDFQHNSEPDGELNNWLYWQKAVEIIGTNMEKIPLIDNSEKTACDTFFTATGNRKYGKQGGPGGSDEV
jgi:hypothetical protein